MSKNDYEKLSLQGEKIGLLKAINALQTLVSDVDRRLDDLEGEGAE